jgi:hypothetical protein
MFKKWIGKRVILWVNTPSHINYVGTLEAAQDNVISLVNVTPMGENRKLSDMIVNFTRERYDKLTLVVDPTDDPSQHTT